MASGVPNPSSAAVMARRHATARGELDYYPTPAWATSALCDWLTWQTEAIGGMTCYEPAAGGGHMADVLAKRFRAVDCTDLADYGRGYPCHDFLAGGLVEPPVGDGTPWDWVITNPPFQSAEPFYRAARTWADRGVALLARLAFVESRGRYERLFREEPPTDILQFVDRVSMVKGRLAEPGEKGATAHAWFVWRSPEDEHLPTRLHWLPHREADYAPR